MFSYFDFKIDNIVLTLVEQGLVGINWPLTYMAHVITRVTSSMIYGCTHTIWLYGIPCMIMVARNMHSNICIWAYLVSCVSTTCTPKLL